MGIAPVLHECSTWDGLQHVFLVFPGWSPSASEPYAGEERRGGEGDTAQAYI